MSIAIGRGEIAATFEETLQSYFPVVVELLSSAGILSRILLFLTLLAIPITVAYILEKYEGVPQKLRNWAIKISGRYERNIEHILSTSWNYMVNNETLENKRLHKALKLYLGKRSKVSSYNSSAIDLVMIRKTKENTCGGQIVRTSQELKNLKIVSFPVIGKWEKIPDTNPLIEIKISESPETCLAESEKRQKTTFHLRTCGKNGNKVLYNFIEKCHEEHNSLLRANEDRSTYFYLLQAGGKVKSKEEEDGDGGDAPIQSIFKRYKLTGERDFSTVFFPEKAKILQLVSDFSQRRGKFAIEGFPQKLGLLLHGPPGTGKTSFVKALATHLKRHIISIPLGKISTNQELYDIIFEGLYPCVNASNNDSGTRKCFRHEFKDVIFLMEEVDAATDIVKSRKAAPTQLTQGGHYQGTTFHRETREDPESTKEDSSDESNCELQGENKESVTNTSNSPRKGINKTDDINKIGEPGAVGVNFKSLFSPADKLDLAGLLNVLDGVVDSPGRVVVMTTNHPENLDPALIRPGRINTKLLLTYMKEKEATEMVEQYFGDIDVSNQEKFHKVWESKQRQKQGDVGEVVYEKTQGISLEEDFKITPAEMEQLCVENDTIEEFISAFYHFPGSPNISQISKKIQEI